MKNTIARAFLALLPLGALVGPAVAQGAPTTPEGLRAAYEAKTSKDFVAHGGWILDYDEARAKAAAEGKLIFAYFTRSYAY